MTSLLADPVAQVIATAEELLTRRVGATVVLAEPEDLGGSGRTLVMRARVLHNNPLLPRSAVIKQLRAADRMSARISPVERRTRRGLPAAAGSAPVSAEVSVILSIGHCENRHPALNSICYL